MGQNHAKQGTQARPGKVGPTLNNGQHPVSDALVGGSTTRHSHGRARAATGDEAVASTSAANVSKGGGTGAPMGLRGDGGDDGSALLSAAPEGRKLPVIIRYKLPAPVPKGTKPPKRDIKLLLDSNDWRPLPMSPSDDNYYAVVYLRPGEHCFRFEVDGEVVLDASQPVRSSGEHANVVNVEEGTLFSHLDEPDLVNDAEGWGQEQREFEETRKHPPIMPPHLRYTPLNTPPTQIRCNDDGSMAPTGAAPLDAEHLPLPMSVTINHAYFQRREDHVVLGVTTRYRSKFTTVVYYKKE